MNEAPSISTGRCQHQEQPLSCEGHRDNVCGTPARGWASEETSPADTSTWAFQPPACETGSVHC